MRHTSKLGPVLIAVALALLWSAVLGVPGAHAETGTRPGRTLPVRPTADMREATSLDQGNATQITPRQFRQPLRRPWPVTITIRTVPPLPGIRLALDGITQRTDAQGRAAFTQQHNFQTHMLNLIDRSIATPSKHYRFVRWAGQRDPDQAFRPWVSGLPMRANYTVTAAFSVQFPVSARFVNQKGHPLDVDRISAVTVKSSTGELVNFPKTGRVWLDGLLPVYRKSAIDSRTVSYSLQQVTVAGTNTVDSGKQTFQPARTSAVTFKTKFYKLTVKGHDGLFHGRAGTQAVLTYPDKTTQAFPFGRDLPRGPYVVRVRAGGAIVTPEEILLSRSATMDLTVVSRLDLVTIVGTFVVVAIGLLLVGRRPWRDRLVVAIRRRRRSKRELSTS